MTMPGVRADENRPLRIFLLLLLVLCCLLLPVTFYVVLLAIHSITPGLRDSLATVTIENRSGEPLEVTPIGTWGGGDNKKLLYIYQSSWPAIQADQRNRFPLEHGEALQLTYQWSEMNFSEIVVKNKQNQYRQLVVDATPSLDPGHRPYQSHYIIPPWDQLVTPPQSAIKLTQVPREGLRAWLPVALGIAAPILLLILWRLYSRQTARLELAETPPEPPQRRKKK